MTKLPRDLSADELLTRLRRLGYTALRQRGSHMTLYTPERSGHRAWVPHHDPISPGTLRSVLGDIAAHYDMTLGELLHKLGL